MLAVPGRQGVDEVEVGLERDAPGAVGLGDAKVRDDLRVDAVPAIAFLQHHGVDHRREPVPDQADRTRVGQRRPHHAPMACLGAIGHILARQEDASQVGAGRVRHELHAAVPRVEGESRRGSAVVADGRRRQSRASQAGAAVVHEPFVPPV